MTERARESAGGEVADAVREMYSSYGDPARFDRFLHGDITIWESDQPGPLLGLAELDSLRRGRSAELAETSGTRPTLAVTDLLVDRWGQVAAVARYLLSAHSRDGVEEFRVTDVLQHESDGWRIVHHHAEALPVTVARHDGAGAGHDDRDGQRKESDRAR